MSVNGITYATQTYENKGVDNSKTNSGKQSDESKRTEQDNTAVVYEKSEQQVETKRTYKPDTVSIERLKAEAEKRTQSLRDLVEKLLLKQGETITDATDIYALLREGKVQVDPATREQAEKDIAEDGYWGVNQTSDRILSFAKALTGGDPSKANDMIDAVKKGFEEATKTWGDSLPDLCKDTLDAAIKKLEAWRDGKDSE